MWGSPGTMLAARAMHDWTGEERWLEAWRESAEALHGPPRPRRALDAAALRQDAAASSARRTVWSAIVHALLQVESEWSESLRRETAEILAREAIVEDGLATWPAVAGGPLVPPATARSGCSGATARPGWSRPRRRTSTRSSCSPAPS